MIGSKYVCRIPSFSRDPAADEVLLRLSAPSTGILLVTRAWFGQVAASSLNEPSSISLVRLSSDGTTGGSPVIEPKMPDHPAFPGSAACLDGDGWGTQPTVANTLEEFAFNLATGFDWAPTDEEDFIVVGPSERVGMRILTSPSASMTWRGGMNVLYIGS